MKETERDAKKQLREIARKLESAQGCATIPQLVDEIEHARSRLEHVQGKLEMEA